MVDDNTAPVPPQTGTDAGQALPQDFESALAQLESLVNRMEDGTLPLEQSLAAYERGVALAQVCQRLLDAAEQQIQVLQGNALRPLSQAGGEQDS